MRKISSEGKALQQTSSKDAALLPVLREKLLVLQTSDSVATPPLSPSPPPPSLYFESSSISSRSSIVEPFDLNVASLYQVFHVKVNVLCGSSCSQYLLSFGWEPFRSYHTLDWVPQGVVLLVPVGLRKLQFNARHRPARYSKLFNVQKLIELSVPCDVFVACQCKPRNSC